MAVLALGDFSTDGSPPKHHSYPQNADCIWSVKSRSYEHVWCQLEHMSTVVSANCVEAGVEMCDGTYTDCSPIGRPICGSLYSNEIGYNATGRLLTVRFSSGDEVPQGKGFKIVCGASVPYFEPPTGPEDAAVTMQIGVDQRFEQNWKRSNPDGNTKELLHAMATGLQHDIMSVLSVA